MGCGVSKPPDATLPRDQAETQQNEPEAPVEEVKEELPKASLRVVTPNPHSNKWVPGSNHIVAWALENPDSIAGCSLQVSLYATPKGGGDVEEHTKLCVLIADVSPALEGVEVLCPKKIEEIPTVEYVSDKRDLVLRVSVEPPVDANADTALDHKDVFGISAPLHMTKLVKHKRYSIKAKSSAKKRATMKIKALRMMVKGGGLGAAAANPMSLLPVTEEPSEAEKKESL